MKSIWVMILSAATVTAYLHVRHKEPIVTHVHHEFAPTATPSPTERGIVVAPFNGGEVGSRLQEPSSGGK